MKSVQMASASKLLKCSKNQGYAGSDRCPREGAAFDGEYIDTNILQLTEAGYDPYLIKSEIVRKINSLRSLDGQEFIYGSNGVTLSSGVRFKEYDRLGTGGFVSVFKGEKGKVYKVLS